ncbi:MAG: hypothetical protein QM757_09495 [Paludibaculum sp.]
MEDKEPRTPPPNALIEKWRDSSLTFSSFASFRPWSITIIHQGTPEQLFLGAISGELLRDLRARRCWRAAASRKRNRESARTT